MFGANMGCKQNSV